MVGCSKALVYSSSNSEVSLFIMVCHNCTKEFAKGFLLGQHSIFVSLTSLEQNFLECSLFFKKFHLLAIQVSHFLVNTLNSILNCLSLLVLSIELEI